MLSQLLHYLTMPYLLAGAGIAIEMWLISFILASFIGLVFALIRTSKRLFILRWIVGFLVWIIRGTPIILQLVIFYNLLPVMGLRINDFWTGVIGLTVCYCAYLCEVFRGGLISVSPGQIEAARSGGFRPIGVMTHFVIPQALRSAFPSLINFTILLMKDTSITSVIAVSELTLRSNTIVARNFEYVAVFGAALIIYLVLTSLLTLFQHYSEKRLNYANREMKLMSKGYSPPASANKKLSDYLTSTNKKGTVPPAVIFDHVTKYFGKNKVIDDMSLTIRSGLTTCIIGPSGAGKSTLLRTINGLEDIDEGKITVNGIIISDRTAQTHLHKRKSQSQRAKDCVDSGTAMVFQQFNLFENHSALENITIAPKKVKQIANRQADSEGQNLLELLNLGHLYNRMPQRLSGGEQQRIGILRALAVKPRTLLFDEPTSALDPERVGEVLDVMKELSDAGGTMVVVTHEMGFARNCADWIVFMENGKIIAQGPPGDMLDTPKSQRLAEFLSGFNRLEASDKT